jgi:DNA processing protein
LAEETTAPPVLFSSGDPSPVDAFPTVAIVGTRTCTRYGLGVAAQLGAELAASGVVVVSGLALGIDGAAHEVAVAGWEAGGAGAGRPVAVVATGLDHPYPARGAKLWEQVASVGAILSEAPIGTTIERWRFPNRNRLLVALVDVAVVVESHHHGGSLHTARVAMDRGVPVGAVPGSIRSPASAGTNDLLADGCFPVRDATDVMVALELARAGSRPIRQRRRRQGRDERAVGDERSGHHGVGRGARSPVAESVVARLTEGAEGIGSGRSAGSDQDGPVLAAIGWERCSLEQILRRTGRSLTEVSVEIEQLAAQGVIEGDGSWWERTGGR